MKNKKKKKKKKGNLFTSKKIIRSLFNNKKLVSTLLIGAGAGTAIALVCKSGISQKIMEGFSSFSSTKENHFANTPGQN